MFSKAFLLIAIVILTFFVTFYYKYSHCSNFDTPLHLTLKQGKILGKKYESALTGKEYYGFSSIPYAKAPIGELRFKAPEAHEGWSGVLDATKERNICLQFNIFNQGSEENEDCLFINVYTPQLKKIPDESKNLLPVMVFIHGGGFVLGSSEKKLYGPDFLIEHGVILVTLNYRLNIFGFLNLGIPDAPGNAGLKDQSLALKWVKENIKSFGGDPESVTLFGQSAGAASVHYQMISPQSKGLFQKSIIQSGNALSGWASTTLTKEITDLLFKATGMDGKQNITTLANTLKSMNAQTLINKAWGVVQQIQKDIPDIVPLVFVPTEESDIEGSFLPGKIEALATNPEPMPVMTGLDESEFITLPGLSEKEDIYDLITNNLPSVLQCHAADLKLTNETRQIVTDEVAEYYYGEKEVNDETFMETNYLFVDLTFNRPLYLSLEYTLRKTSMAYVYLFALKGDMRISKILNLAKMFNYPVENVTIHGDELGYLFHTSNTNKELLSIQKNIDAINEICTLWTNFAKTGDPNGNALNRTWKASTIDKHSYLEINENMVTINSRMHEDRMEFWDKLKKKYSNH